MTIFLILSICMFISLNQRWMLPCLHVALILHDISVCLVQGKPLFQIVLVCISCNNYMPSNMFSPFVKTLHCVVIRFKYFLPNFISQQYFKLYFKVCHMTISNFTKVQEILILLYFYRVFVFCMCMYK